MPEFYRALYRWYHEHGRHDLPWRNISDPYPIWISEVMLQQTQVPTVRDRYYSPFLRRFPTVMALAEADLQQVLQIWQGLGYYNRARNLHLAAQRIADTGFPETISELQKLPGIGRNTAHAIAAFAFHQAEAVMEANVKRVLCRIHALEAPGNKELWEQATRLLDRSSPFDYNQAMMDLGALICTPKTPQCGQCPAAVICKGKKAPENYPKRTQKKAIPLRKRNIILFTDSSERIFIQKRTEKFLHGLWAFPEYEEDKYLYFNNIKYKLNLMKEVCQIHHVYSHFRLEATVYRQPVPILTNGKTITEIRSLPISRTERKILRLIDR